MLVQHDVVEKQGDEIGSGSPVFECTATSLQVMEEQIRQQEGMPAEGPILFKCTDPFWRNFRTLVEIPAMPPGEPLKVKLVKSAGKKPN